MGQECKQHVNRTDKARSDLSQTAGGGDLRRKGSLVARTFGEGSTKQVLLPGVKSLGGSQDLF